LLGDEAVVAAHLLVIRAGGNSVLAFFCSSFQRKLESLFPSVQESDSSFRWNDEQKKELDDQLRC
jgi:hypothetical protein